MLNTPLDWFVFVFLVVAIGIAVRWAMNTFPASRTLVFTLGICGMLLLPFMAIVGLEYANPKYTGVEAYEMERGAERASKVRELKNKWQGQLTTVAWVDKEKGLAQIPVKDAMELSLAKLNEGEPKATSTKVVPIQPAAAPAPAPAPEPKEEAPAKTEEAPKDEAAPEAAAGDAQPEAADPAAPEGDAAPTAGETPAETPDAPAPEGEGAEPAPETAPAPSEPSQEEAS